MKYIACHFHMDLALALENVKKVLGGRKNLKGHQKKMKLHNMTN